MHFKQTVRRKSPLGKEYCILSGDVVLSKRVLDFCNLKWEAECLKFYENKAPSTTASAIQVRQAVYKTSVDQWRKYTPYLRELSTILIKAGVDVS